MGEGTGSSSAACSSSLHDDPCNAPFRRHDRYGHFGTAPQPLLEQLRLAVMTVLVFPLRLCMVIGCMIIVHLGCWLSDLLPQSMRSDWCASVCCFWCTLAVNALGFNVVWVKLEGDNPKVRPAGIVSNHCSWADIIINLAHNCPSFAAREGTEKLPLIGTISLKIQCLYVLRWQKDGKGVSTAIKERMQAKHRNPHNKERLMLLFPEGTTTNGRYLLPFKTGAFLAGLPLQPVLMHYDTKSALSPCWDTIKPGRHIWLLLCQPLHNVTCYELPVYVPSAEEQADPVLYASNMRNYMLTWGRKLGMQLDLSDSTYDTKMDYHAALKFIKARPPRSNQITPQASGNQQAEGEGLRARGKESAGKAD